MQKVNSSLLSIIPNTLLTDISGGNDTPSSPVSVNGQGGPNGAGGSVAVSVPVGPVIVTPYVSGDTNNGVTGGGVGFTVPWG